MPRPLVPGRLVWPGDYVEANSSCARTTARLGHVAHTRRGFVDTVVSASTYVSSSGPGANHSIHPRRTRHSPGQMFGAIGSIALSALEWGFEAVQVP